MDTLGTHPFVLCREAVLFSEVINFCIERTVESLIYLCIIERSSRLYFIVCNIQNIFRCPLLRSWNSNNLGGQTSLSNLVLCRQVCPLSECPLSEVQSS